MINFHNIDCIEFMKTKSDKCYDLAIVDPDYGLDEKISSGGTWAAKYKKGAGYLGGKPTAEYFNTLFRVSKNWIIWGGNYFTENIPSARCYIVWRKLQMLGMHTMADCELALTSFDKNAKIFDSNSARDRIHICQKPIILYRWCLQNFAENGFKILDTHGGSHTHAIACDMEGFDLDICEIDKEYFDDGVKAFKEYKRQLTLF